MSRRLLIAILGAGICLPTGARAQTLRTAPTTSDCSYSVCALRVEPTMIGPRLRRGTTGEGVSLGAWGGNANELFSRSDSAARHAARYVRAVRQQAVVSVLGFAGFVTLLARTDMGRAHFDTGDAIVATASGALALASIPLGIRAQRHLVRAVWWYNATLPR